ncbi:hypothetical protein AmaxDRAFT_2128 [Limnospira maxima CS-328]|uniref:Uncharacterized protein n=1 Tax=Limnospira maxima CS-328 TaxID=513049 RepID=B5W036_LIMMA|nr:hypothetical protein AmaxDRAFT_2128 [Limnospira maxima CS-328]
MDLVLMASFENYRLIIPFLGLIHGSDATIYIDCP